MIRAFVTMQLLYMVLGFFPLPPIYHLAELLNCLSAPENDLGGLIIFGSFGSKDTKSITCLYIYDTKVTETYQPISYFTFCPKAEHNELSANYFLAYQPVNTCHLSKPVPQIHI